MNGETLKKVSRWIDFAEEDLRLAVHSLTLDYLVSQINQI
jgi:hypothetical protein